jgi:hypothetical protein
VIGVAGDDDLATPQRRKHGATGGAGTGLADLEELVRVEHSSSHLATIVTLRLREKANLVHRIHDVFYHTPERFAAVSVQQKDAEQSLCTLEPLTQRRGKRRHGCCRRVLQHVLFAMPNLTPQYIPFISSVKMDLETGMV